MREWFQVPKVIKEQVGEETEIGSIKLKCTGTKNTIDVNPNSEELS